MTEQERLIQANLEALTDKENDGPVKCTAGWTECATNGTTTLFKP